MLQTIAYSPVHERFLFDLFASTRPQEAAVLPPPLLEHQFRLMQQTYISQFPDADHRIILWQGQRAGRIMVARLPDQIRLVDVALLPRYRQKGIGTSLLRQLQAEAAATRKPLRLQVTRFNPARRLYERLGFVCTAEDGLYCSMQWQP